jgi:hypothetical protein
MFLGGVASHSIALWILPMLQDQIQAHLPAPVDEGAILAINVIAALVSLGGITVILGGISLLLGHKSIGRMLVALGGGAGVIGLLLALGYYLMVNGPEGVSSHVGYWAGVALAVVARWIAGKA